MAKKIVMETKLRRSSRLAGKEVLAPVPEKVAKARKGGGKVKDQVNDKATRKVTGKATGKANNKVKPAEDDTTSTPNNQNMDKLLSYLQSLESTDEEEPTENKTKPSINPPDNPKDQTSGKLPFRDFQQQQPTNSSQKPTRRSSPRTSTPPKPKLQTVGKRVQFDAAAPLVYIYSPVESLSSLTAKQLVDALFDHVCQIIMLLNRWNKLTTRLTTAIGAKDAAPYTTPDGVRDGYGVIYAVLMVMRGGMAAIPAVKVLGAWTPTQKATQVAMLNQLLENQVGPTVVGGEGRAPHWVKASRATNREVKKIKTAFAQIRALHNSMDLLLADLTNGASWEKTYQGFAKGKEDGVSGALLGELVVVPDEPAESPTSPPCSPLVLYRKPFDGLGPKAKAKVLADLKASTAKVDAVKAAAKARRGKAAARAGKGKG